jgi:hypothetical protein
MEEWAAKFGWKKVAAIFIIVAVLAIIYAIFSMIEANKPVTNFQNSSNTPQKVGQSSYSGFGANNTNQGSDNPSSASENGNITNYKASQFNISYPSNFTKSETANPATKEDIVTLKGPQNVTMQFHFYPGTTPANAITGPFQSLGFREDDYEFEGFSGKTFTGKVGNNPTHQEQLIVFAGENKNGQGVLFGAFLDYLSTTRNYDIENNFQNIVKSFNF